MISTDTARPKQIFARRAIGGAACWLMLAACLASPAAAQAPGNGLATSYNANANMPIDIEADALEVDDKKKLAVFTGNVSATQGDFNLKAREIQVAYAAAPKKDEAAGDVTAATASANSPLPGGGGADITQIDAKGKVLITTKDSQTATSDWAVFEVKKQLVTIGGDVVLTQGTNTIKGSRLVIDLNTGLSRFETSGGKTADGDAPRQRLKAIFTPKSRPEAAKPDATKPPPKTN